MLKTLTISIAAIAIVIGLSSANTATNTLNAQGGKAEFLLGNFVKFLADTYR